MDDVVANKIATIEKCLARVAEEYVGYEQDFYTNYTKQDSIILNIERATQAAIDTAMHIVRIKNLGLPQSSRDVFVLLTDKQIINQATSIQMQKMVGFRNIAVHDYQKLNLEIVVAIIDKHLADFKQFTSAVLSYEDF